MGVGHMEISVSRKQISYAVFIHSLEFEAVFSSQELEKDINWPVEALTIVTNYISKHVGFT
jgi:hypothetical protein